MSGGTKAGGPPHAAVLLRLVAAFLEELPPAQYQALLAGQACLAVVPRHETLPAPVQASPGRVASLDPGPIHEGLGRLSTREEGRAWLAAHKLSKAALVAALRDLDVHVTSRDNIAVLQDKLIEAEIGRRLRSEAIEQTPLVRRSP